VKFDNFNVGPQAKLYGSDSNTGHIGEIISYAGTIVPDRHLSCNGAAVSRATYGELFTAIGITYGVGNGSTTFNLPNTNGIFLKGAGSQTIGGIVHAGTLGTTENDMMQGHYHDFGAGSAAAGSINAPIYSGNFSTLQSLTVATGAAIVRNQITDGTNGTPRIGTETKPANVTINYAIRYTGAIQSQVMSSDADTRVVAARYNSTSTTITNSSTTLLYTTKEFDTHGAYNTSTGGYTVPVAGVYKVSASIWTSSVAWTVGQDVSITLTKGGVDTILSRPIAPAATIIMTASGSTLVNCVAGDVLTISSLTVRGSTTLLNDARGNWATFERLAGPAQIAASESVNALYTGAPPTGTLAASFNKTTYGTKVKDSHNAYSAGVYTIPVSGTYSISARNAVSGTYALSNATAISIFIDGANTYFKYTYAAGAFGNIDNDITVLGIPLLAGQTVEIRTYIDAPTPAYSSSSGRNTFSITRSGNY
jgi:microcystin-dependent protein